MGAELVVDLACPVREVLGEGEVEVGGEELLARYRARLRAWRVLGEPGLGPDLATVEVEVRTHTPAGLDIEVATLPDLLLEAAPLEELTGACVGCPANVRNSPVGCVTRLDYPIPLVVQEWLVAQVLGPEAIGGWLFRDAVAELGYDGGPMAEWRAAGFLEGDVSVRRDLPDGFAVSSDQLLQAILAVGERLHPVHCLLVLIWLGQVTLDGAVITDPPVLPLLRDMDGDERLERTGLAGGVPRELREVLRAMLAAWQCDVHLRVSS